MEKAGNDSAGRIVAFDQIYSVTRKAGHVMNSCALRVGWPGFVTDDDMLNEGTTFPSAKGEERARSRISRSLAQKIRTKKIFIDRNRHRDFIAYATCREKSNVALSRKRSGRGGEGRNKICSGAH